MNKKTIEIKKISRDIDPGEVLSILEDMELSVFQLEFPQKLLEGIAEEVSDRLNETYVINPTYNKGIGDK